MISSDILPDNGQLEPCSDDLQDHSFSHSETDPDTTYLPPGLEDTDHNKKFHVYFDEYSSMPPIVNLTTAGLQGSARLSGKPPNKITVLLCKKTIKYLSVDGIALASLWLPRESSLHSRAQIFVNNLVNTFHSEDKNFDNTLNALYP